MQTISRFRNGLSGDLDVAKQKRNNQGAALTRVLRVWTCAQRIAVHSPEASLVGRLAPRVEVPSRQLYDLRVALENAGVDMARARIASARALKANSTIRAKKGKN
jgi:hypothetical protein